jgi:ParB family chromosome partitioning protein
MATVRVSEIEVGPRHRKDLGDIAALARSIQEVGLLRPIVITPGKELIAGARRLAAVKELKWSDIPVRIVDLDNLLFAGRDATTSRNDFTPSEAVAIGQALEDREKAHAKARQNAGVHRHIGPSGQCPEGPKGQTRDKVAEAVGLSGKTYEKAKAVVAAAEQSPAEFGPVAEEMDRTGKVDPAYQKVKRQRPTRRRTSPLLYAFPPEVQALVRDTHVGGSAHQVAELIRLNPKVLWPLARVIADHNPKTITKAMEWLILDLLGTKG